LRQLLERAKARKQLEWAQTARLAYQTYQVLRGIAASFGGKQLPDIPEIAFNPMRED
jgi:hypothetical protein